MDKGCIFCEAQPQIGGDISMDARGFYNLKLGVMMENIDEIVTNDLFFDEKHCVYILTGANRGGKTTITQAVGQLFVLAQGGLFVPGESFRYVPCDCIYTHFPADEDKTMDLGRLGEECVRFREMFSQATDRSLMLLNETFLLPRVFGLFTIPICISLVKLLKNYPLRETVQERHLWS